MGAGDYDQNSAGERRSGEQIIKPLTENLVLSANNGFCQSSGDEPYLNQCLSQWMMKLTMTMMIVRIELPT